MQNELHGMPEAEWAFDMTPQEELIGIIVHLQTGVVAVTALKAKPDEFDARGVSIALTHLETAMLWVANALKEE